jgi:nucleoside-diphosphate-sugar epimerase
VDAIVHLAARVHVMSDYSMDPLAKFRRVNTDGRLNLARQAALGKVRRLVFISSIKVNGDSTSADRPFQPSDPVHPNEPYGQSKYEAEEGLRPIAKETGLEVVVVRPPLVYGFGVKANFSALARLVRRGFPLPLGLVVNNRRSLVGVENLVDFLRVSIDHREAVNQTFMVSDGEDLSTAGLIHRMAKAMDRRAKLVPVPCSVLRGAANLLDKGEVADRLLGSLQLSIELNHSLLGWTPPISVDDGLRCALNNSVVGQN